jgi:hypothetical protein
MTLELDHVFCLVDPAGDWAARLEGAGWRLDEGSVHAGQGTRNRRLAWPEHYLELLWVADEPEARANPLRLDRRADWRRSGASPFGIGLRGELSEAQREDYWRYEALGLPIWIHRDDERAPERPLVFVLETAPDALESRRPRTRAPEALAHRRPGALRSVRLTGPAPPALPPLAGPRIDVSPGRHRLEVVVGEGPRLPVTDVLGLVG